MGMLKLACLNKSNVQSQLEVKDSNYYRGLSNKWPKLAIIFDSGTGRTKQVAIKIEEGIKCLDDTNVSLFNVEEALEKSR